MTRILDGEDAAQLARMEPGDVLLYDYRADEDRTTRKLSDTVRVAQWNIERGAKLDGIAATLRACQADVVCLQELDIGCARSHYENVPQKLAQALQMQCVFVCEFEELDDPSRSPQNAVGPRSQQPRCQGDQKSSSTACALPGRHFHGNAILSRTASLSEPTVIPHSSAFPWEREGARLCEPRRGFRSALRVCIDAAVSGRSFDRMPPLYIYCCHLEVFCGALSRVRQLGDCIDDARLLLQRHLLTSREAKGGAAAGPSAAAASSDGAPSFLIAGDLNTMAHGVVRFSPTYARDRMRLLSLGETEAMWLQRKVLSRGMTAEAGVTRGCCPLSYRFPAYALSWLYAKLCDSALVWRVLYGFTSHELQKLSNTLTCFYDPSDKYATITLNNPQYAGLVQGKLDWVLLSHLTVRPFRAERGGARPVDVETLKAMGSLQEGSPSTRYLESIYGKSAATDEARELTAHTVARAVPNADGGARGLVLFNENYTESDHRGILITVQQTGRPSSMPADSYPPYGAEYTRNLLALGTFAASRAVSWGLLAALGVAVYRRAVQPSLASS